MESIWSTVYSALPLLVLLGVVYVAFRSSGLLLSPPKSQPIGQKRAVPVPASSDHQQSQSTPKFAPLIDSPEPQKASQAISNGLSSGVSSAMPTPERKGFQRGKKLA